MIISNIKEMYSSTTCNTKNGLKAKWKKRNTNLKQEKKRTKQTFTFCFSSALICFFLLLSTGSLWSHFKTFVFPVPNWFQAVNLLCCVLEIRMHIYLEKGIGPLHQTFDKTKSTFDIQTHKSNWIPIDGYITILIFKQFPGVFPSKL